MRLNCRYPRHHMPARARRNESTSMNTGFCPRSCTFPGAASLSSQPFAKARSSTFNCKSVALRSMEKGHSKG